MNKVALNWQANKIKSAQSHQNLGWDSGINNLEFQKRNGKQLTLKDGREVVEFVSCSYLGLETDESLITAAKDSLDRYGTQFAAARTRVRPDFYAELDSALSEICQKAHVTTFNAVSPCHSAVFPLLACGELPHFEFNCVPEFFIDKSAHASIQLNRGLLMQFGSVKRINFMNLDEVETYVGSSKARGAKPILISDSVGSMGGMFPIRDLVTVSKKYGAYLYLDDAHGTSVFGKNGCGYVLDQTIEDGLPSNVIMAGSLCKAYGGHGGFVATPFHDTNEFIRRHGSTYIFGGPPCLPGLASCLASSKLHLDGTVEKLQTRLQGNIVYFDQVFDGTVNRGKTSPIRGIKVGDERRAVLLSKAIQGKGYAVTAAMFPTVGLGNAILRCAISAIHGHDQILGLGKAFEDASNEIEEMSPIDGVT